MSELPERSGGRGLCTAMLFLMALALVTSGPLSFAGGKDKQKEQKNGGQKKQKTEEKKKQTKKLKNRLKKLFLFIIMVRLKPQT